MPGFFLRICPHALRALNGDHSSTKSDNFPHKSVPFPPECHSPKSVSVNDLTNIMSVWHVKLTTFVQPLLQSHLIHPHTFNSSNLKIVHHLHIPSRVSRSRWMVGRGGEVLRAASPQD